jgi:hypothetical protein
MINFYKKYEMYYINLNTINITKHYNYSKYIYFYNGSVDTGNLKTLHKSIFLNF